MGNILRWENFAHLSFLTPLKRGDCGGGGGAAAGATTGEPEANTVQENFPERAPTPQGQTRDLVAKATGFGSGKTYEQAKPTQSKPLLQKP